MSKQGTSHIEFILSFVIFVGFIIFLLYFFNPMKKASLNEGMLDQVKEAIDKQAEITVLTADVVLNTSPGAGYPSQFQPCFGLGKVDISQADVVLITDVSGSMRQNITAQKQSDPRGTTINDCNDPRILGDLNTSRMSVAKCLAKEFVNILLNGTNNQVGLVAYANTANLYSPLTNNNVSLISQIDTYSANGDTCTCCGINRAHQILAAGDPLRKKFIVLFSDGVANRVCNSTDFYHQTLPMIPTNPPYPRNPASAVWQRCSFSTGADPGTSYSFRVPPGTDTESFPGFPNMSHFPIAEKNLSGMCGGSYSCNITPPTNALEYAAYNHTLWSANRTAKEINVNISTIGLLAEINGCPSGEAILRQVAQKGGGAYRAATNSSELAAAYRELAQSIIEGTQVFAGGEPMIAHGAGGTLLPANNSGGYPFMAFGGGYYELASSPPFQEVGLDTSLCKLLNETQYSVGLIQNTYPYSYDALLKLNESYHADYIGLKYTLKIPGDFGFIVRDTEGNILINAINRKATKVHVLARDIPALMTTNHSEVKSVIINLQTW